MDYQFKQEFPIATQQSKTSPIEIAEDFSLPHIQQPCMNDSYNSNAPKQDITIQPLEYGNEISSGSANTLRFVINGDPSTVIDPHETYIDFNLQIDQGTDATALGLTNVDSCSCIGALNTAAQSIRPQALKLCTTSSTVNYCYVPNSAAFFQKIVLRDLRTGQEIVSTESPSLILKLLTEASMPGDILDPNETRILEEHLCHVNKFVPDDVLAVFQSDSTTLASLSPAYTPSGNYAPLNNWASSVNSDYNVATSTVISTCKQNVCNSIPYFDMTLLEQRQSTLGANRVYQAATISGLTANTTSGAVSISAAAMSQLSGYINCVGDLTASDTLVFPEVRRQLNDIARGRKFRLNLGLVLDIFNSAVKLPINFCPLQLDFILNSYANAVTDLSATAASVGSDWTRTSTFKRFKLIYPRLHVSKYTLRAEVTNELVKKVATEGIIIPFSHYYHTVENLQSTSSNVYLGFRDKRVRSLSKLVVIPRFNKCAQEDATANKLVWNVGGRPDCDGGTTRLYDGIYSFWTQWNNISMPHSDRIYMEPYKMTDIKNYSGAIFNEYNTNLLQGSFEGISDILPIEKSFCYGNQITSAPNAAASSTSTYLINTACKMDCKAYHQGSMSGFFIGYDFRSFKGGMYSGLDISKADLNITISRKKTDATTTPDVQLDIYYICEAALKIKSTEVQFTM